MTTDFSYAGQYGMIQHWQRHHYIFAVRGKKGVLVMQDNTIEDARKNLKELTRLTGLKMLQEKPKEKALIPDLRVEIGGQKTSLKESQPVEVVLKRQAFCQENVRKVCPGTDLCRNNGSREPFRPLKNKFTAFAGHVSSYPSQI